MDTKIKTLLFYPKLEKTKPFHHIPITALAVAANLFPYRHDVTIWDDRVGGAKVVGSSEKTKGSRKTTRAKTLSGRKALDTLINKSDQIMISAFTGYQLSEAYRFAKSVKATYPDKKIIIGGPHATALPAQTLASPYIDEVFRGDIDSGRRPLPYWLINLKKYINPATKRFTYVSSYGCNGRCTFCTTKDRRLLRLMPLERVEKDINYLMKHYRYKEAVFFDATVFTKPERALFIAKLMEKHKLSWICDARADEVCRMPAEILERVISSGLSQITVGLESGSPRVLRTMLKGNGHLGYFMQAAENLKQFPVKMVSGVVFGTPGETVEDLQLTIDYIQQIREINPNFRISTTFYRPLPGTVMADMCKEYGYKEPRSLSGWAELGQGSHYNYNVWQDAPWIIESDKYRQVYDRFVAENSDLFI